MNVKFKTWQPTWRMIDLNAGKEKRNGGTLKFD